MKQDEIKKTLIDNVGEYAGSAAGAVAGGLIGAAIGGPEGAAAGSVAATAIEHMFQNMGSEIKKRTLAPLEEQRVGTVYAKAKELIEEKIAQGKTPETIISSLKTVTADRQARSSLRAHCWPHKESTRRKRQFTLQDCMQIFYFIQRSAGRLQTTSSNSPNSLPTDRLPS